MQKILLIILSAFSFSSFFLTPALTQAESLYRLAERAQNAAAVLEEVVSIPDKSIPISLLERATCVATIPNVIRAGFVFGARFGKGLVSCRVAEGWSRPSYIQIQGGSWGYQFGIQAVDLVLVFVRDNAIEKLSKANFSVGADASVAAGPLGRDAQLGTDYRLSSEIYSYSRARGLFAGLSIQGTLISIGRDENEAVYGNVNVINLLSVDGMTSPATVLPYVHSLMTYAH